MSHWNHRVIRRGLPINEHGNHRGEGAWDIIGCTANRYRGDAFDSAEFRRLCQAYRWTREIDGPEIVKAFEDLQEFCRKAVEQGKSPR